MATSYHVRLRGKVHGPFNGSQLKKLVQKGQITEEAEISQDDGEKWYSATKVAGLFDDAPAKSKTSAPGDDGDSPRSRKSASGQATKERSTTERAKSATKKKRVKKATKAVVEADDVFDLDSDDGDEFEDADFLDGDDAFDEADFFDDGEDDFEPVARPTSTKKKRSRKSGSFGLNPGLITFAVAGFLYAAAWSCSLLGDVIASFIVLTGTSIESIASAIDWSMTFARIGLPIHFGGGIALSVGMILCFVSPKGRGPFRLGIASLVCVGTMYAIFGYVLISSIFAGNGMEGVLRMMENVRENIGVLLLAGVCALASAILFPLYVKGLAGVQRDSHQADAAQSLVWMVVGAFGVAFVGNLLKVPLRGNVDPKLGFLIISVSRWVRDGLIIAYAVRFGIISLAIRE